jgi:tetratricopeptide (TPR) repeat protein
VALGFLSFAPTLRVGFIWDDHEMIEKNPYITSITVANIRHAFGADVFDGKGNAYYRPLQTVMNMIDYAVWGQRSFGFHLTNLLFHLAAAALLFSVLALIFEFRLALVTASFFAVHPIVVEQLIIIAGRAEFMSMAFLLLALRLALVKKPWAYVLAGGAYLLACLSKESGVMFPAFLFLIGLYDKKWRTPWKAYAGYAVVLIGFLMLRRAVVAEEIHLSVGELSLALVRDMPTIFLEYIRVLLFPVDLHSHRRMMFRLPFLYLSPLFFVLIGVALWRRRSRVGLFAAAWFLMGMLPKIPALASNSLMLDHWGYMSGVGVYLLLAAVVQSSWFAVGGIILFWTLLSWRSISQRNTDTKLYEQALRYPTSSIVRSNLALMYTKEGRFDEAEALVDEALDMNPQNEHAQRVKAFISSSRPRS